MAAVTFATSSVAALGAAPLAAHEILRQIFMVGTMSVEPLGISAQALVSRARGLGDVDGALNTANRLLQLALCVGCCSGMVVLLLAPLYSAQVSPDATVVSLTHLTIPLLALFQPLEEVMAVSDHVLYGADDDGLWREADGRREGLSRRPAELRVELDRALASVCVRIEPHPGRGGREAECSARVLLRGSGP